MTNNRSALEEYLSLSPSTVDQLIQGGSLDNATLEAVQRSLNVSAPGNLWEVVTSIRDVAAGVYNVLNRFDWNVFYPLNSEGTTHQILITYSMQLVIDYYVCLFFPLSMQLNLRVLQLTTLDKLSLVSQQCLLELCLKIYLMPTPLSQTSLLK